MKHRWWILAMMFVCWPVLAFAHPGHGRLEPTRVTHDHVIPIGLLIAAIIIAAVVFQRWRARRL